MRVKEVYEPARRRNPIRTAQGNKDTVVGLYQEVVTGEDLDLADEELTPGCVAQPSLPGGRTRPLSFQR